MTKLASLLRCVSLVSDPVTAGLALGIYGGTQKVNEDKTATAEAVTSATDKANSAAIAKTGAQATADTAASQSKAYQLQTTEATNSALRGASAAVDKSSAAFASESQSIATKAAQGNKNIAAGVAAASTAESAALAAAGASGLKNVGSQALTQGQAKAQNDLEISDATKDLNTSIKSAATSSAFSRDAATSAADDIIKSYSEGGDQYKVYAQGAATNKLQQEAAATGVQQADNSVTAAGHNLDNAKVDDANANNGWNQALTIATGALNGGEAGLSIGTSIIKMAAMG